MLFGDSSYQNSPILENFGSLPYKSKWQSKLHENIARNENNNNKTNVKFLAI